MLLETDFIHFSFLPSTNTWAKENYNKMDPNKITIVTADGQSQGRGRYGRYWHSPSHENLYATYCLFISPEKHPAGEISKILAIATVHMLKKHNLTAILKWPNDIMCDEKKIGGILAETIAISNVQKFVALGIGLNIFMKKSSHDLAGKPFTSMSLLGIFPSSVNAIANELSVIFSKLLADYITYGFSHFLKEYSQLIGVNNGKIIAFSNQQRQFTGTILNITSDGTLLFQEKDGSLHLFQSGEII